MTLLTEPRRERKINFGSVQLSFRMPNRAALSIIRSSVYRHAIRPSARSLYAALRGLKHSAAAQAAPSPALIPDQPPQPEDIDQQAIEIIQQIADIDWHNTIDLGHDVCSPGVVDHRWQRDLYGLPPSLDGMRCLDLGTRDGFWAFEMERRGAAEVLGLDLVELARGSDWARGFEAARKLLGSKASRAEISIDELTAQRFGRFDLVFVDYLFTELRDPQRTLERVYAVASDLLILASRIDKELEPLKDIGPFSDPAVARFTSTIQGPVGWLPNTQTLLSMMSVAGFEPVDEVARFDIRGDDPEMHSIVLRGRVPERHSWQVFTRSGGLIPLEPQLTRRRTWRLGQFELAVIMPDEKAARITRHPAYRWFAGPAIRATSARPEQAKSSVSASPPAQNGEHANGTSPETTDVPATDLAREISRIGWYHSIDLGNGLVTKGFVDHRGQLDQYQLPPSMAGMRCLDVATFDGYFAFEMERRGATEVIALDISTFSEVDMPVLLAKEEFIRRRTEGVVGAGFRIAHRALRSKVKHVEGNVYDLRPSSLGQFDFVLLSDLIVHLRDPLLALQRIFSVCSDTFVLAEMFHPGLEGLEGGPVSQYTMRMPYSTEAPMELWWIHSVNSLRAMLQTVGFETVAEVSRFELSCVLPGCQKVVLRARVPNPRSASRALSDSESIGLAGVGAR